MTIKLATVALLSAALAVAPLSQAHAEGWHHHGYGGGYGGGWHHDHDFGLIAGVAAITGAAVAVATLPFRAVAEVVEPARPVYAPQPVYYSTGYYQPAPVYAAPVYQPRQVIYSYPAAYPAQTYYEYPND